MVKQDLHIRVPKSNKTLYIVPFSDKQIEIYLKEIVTKEKSQRKDWEFYKDKLNSIYNLKELATNPLLLSIITTTLPKVNIGDVFTRTKLYQEFFYQWFEREENRLKIRFNRKLFFEFTERLAFEMFLSGKTEIKYEMEEFLFEDNREKDVWGIIFGTDNPKVVLARLGCPIQRSGDNKYRFMHKSFQEYCVAKMISEEISQCEKINKENLKNFNTDLLTHEPAIIQFLAEMDIDSQKLLDIIMKSNDDHEIEIASSNAATILNAKRIPFSRLDLRGVLIPGADLSGALLEETNLSYANIREVNFKNTFLKNTNLSNSIMTGAEFGELPCILGHSSPVNSLSFSPDGSILASGSSDKTICLWDIPTGKLTSKLSDL